MQNASNDWADGQTKQTTKYKSVQKPLEG